MKFIDEVKIWVKAGDGGAGSVSFRREKFVPKGGPDGGNGGRGGNVVLSAEEGLSTLLDYRYKREFKARPGESGGGSQRTGADGEDVILRVPVGTIVRLSDSKSILSDLKKNGEQFILCRGGRGGKGNAHFKTSTHQTPRFAQPGEPGEEAEIVLELRALADVGLVGMPNAGKSTLISRISAAKPKIADYPFTTLAPNLGVVGVGREKSFVVADIPGLIEGARHGAGLGNRFLKHIQRTRIIVHMIDVSDGQDPKNAYEIITRELMESPWGNALKDRMQIVALNKVDACTEKEKLDEFIGMIASRGFDKNNIFTISAVSGEGVDLLLKRITYVLFKSRETSQ